jgi:hypothetical protein
MQVKRAGAAVEQSQQEHREFEGVVAAPHHARHWSPGRLLGFHATPPLVNGVDGDERALTDVD